MEHVDVVDSEDNVLYSVSKEETHTKGLLHRTVICEVKNSNNDYLFVRQSPQKQDPGLLVSPMGGHVTAGETEEDALKREMEEELGYTNFEYKLIGKVMYNRPVKDRIENHFFIVFEAVIDKDPILNEEASSFEWIPIKELAIRINSNKEEFGAPLKFILKELYKL